MTISEQQRRTLDLMAESAGWSWHDVEEQSQKMFGESVSGLSSAQAQRLMAVLAKYQEEAGDARSA